MTDKDKKLIDEAEHISCYKWPDVLDLIEKADTAAARLVLNQIAKQKHHMDEAKAGMI